MTAAQGGDADGARGHDTALDPIRELTEQREADAREAQRHLRNVLSVVRSLARRTADEVGSLDEFRVLFDGRLGAYARAQSALGRDTRTGLELGRLIGDECLSFGIGVGEGAVELDGGPVHLLPRAAGLIALLAHELVAELAAGGRAGAARIAWAEGDDLAIDWTQQIGVHAFRPLPDWIRQAIAYELKGRVAEEQVDGLTRRQIRLPRDCYI